MHGVELKITTAGWRDNGTTAFFCYELTTLDQTYRLEETLEFPRPISDTYETKQLLKALHIALSISYYKVFVPPKISHMYEMSETEAAYWNTVFRNGLSEFMYFNKIHPDTIASFSKQSGAKTDINQTLDFDGRALLGIGGGKDSIVAGELLRYAEIPMEGFVLATGHNTGQSTSVADVMGVSLNVIRRTIDSSILELNKHPNALNGHIPVSLIFALVGCMLACESRSSYVVVANESSASIPQQSWGELQVNHQWSKSLEFERLFQDYLRANVSKDLHYFSAIRPLSSAAVAKIFSKHHRYFEVFTSDNSLLRIEQAKREHPRWSSSSSKSLSSYLLLAPYLSDEELLRIFGSNYMTSEDSYYTYSRLLGISGEPILDCVGTPGELQLSMQLLLAQNRYADTKLMHDFKEMDRIQDVEELFTLGEHAIPEELQEIVKAMQHGLQ